MTKNPDTPEFGGGIFSIRDISVLLHKSPQTVNRWLNEFWGGNFGEEFGHYYFGEPGSRAVNFYTLIEFLTFARLRANFSPQKIKKFHVEISTVLKTKHPFAHTKLKTDSKHVWFEAFDELIKLDGKKQLSLSEILGPLLTKIEFDDNRIAKRYFPLGKERNIVIDPNHQFGAPTIKGTNITTDTIYGLYKINEPKKAIMNEYNLTLEQVEDVIEFCENKAA